MKRILLCGLLAIPLLVQGQVLRDPTLPPASVSSPQPANAYGSGEFRLEAIRRLPGKPRLAMISGQLVKVGDEIAGRKVVRIGEHEVKLQSGDQTEILQLAPAVEKTMKTNQTNRQIRKSTQEGGA